MKKSRRRMMKGFKWFWGIFEKISLIFP